MVKELKQEFIARYGKEPWVIAAPGRVNLIGEHTDYNEGFVLPGAVDKKIYVAIAPNDTDKVNVYARQFDQSYSFDINNTTPDKGWVNYLLGVSFFIQRIGTKIKGVDICIDGDVPVGAGMSSSAALCSAYGFALNELFDLGYSRMELAVIGQQTEHEFAGVMCGIMDQFASLHGKAGHVMKLDCRSLQYEYIPFNFPDYSIVLVNTMVSHSLAGTEYNIRRQQCEEGVEILKKHFPKIQTLRDVNYEQLAAHWQELPTVIFDRCSYVVNENQRLFAGCEALKQGNLKGFGEMMYATHKGLSKRYEVSCKELDFLVEQARHYPDIVGARMMGGGFGGCTINIIENNGIERFSQGVSKKYQEQFGIIPEVYRTRIEEGAQILSK
jgi:galactokinase